MFDAEKLLGGLLGTATRGRGSGLGGLVTSGVAMGALGVAMEAVEHFMNKPKDGQPPGPASGRPVAPGSPPPPPPMAGKASVPPPPPPGSPPSVAPPPAGVEAHGESDAVLLIRAMIAAANADGVIDQKERDTILRRLEAVDLSPEEHAFVVQELLSPADLDAIVAAVGTPALARQVYAVSLMAIEVDTDRERAYLKNLAHRLALDDAAIQRIHGDLGLASV